MMKRILVPLDGSPLGERALPLARQLAERAGLEVILLRVPVLEAMLVPIPEGIGGYGLLWPNQALEHSRAETLEYLEATSAKLESEAFAVRTKVIEGDPASVIQDTARKEEVDLIVMSTHGYSGIARWVMGSVAERVLRRAPCPVLVVRTDSPIKRMMITLDGSELSERALAPALEIAGALKADVRLLRAVHEADTSRDQMSFLDDLEQGLGEQMLRKVYEEAKAYLGRLAKEHTTEDLSIQTLVVVEPAAESILEMAEVHKVDLIAMATHGHTGVRRWVYGSVTEKVLRGGCCSMLIVPSHSE